MSAARRCSECSKSLAGKASQAVTCSTVCRNKRSRRIRQANIVAQENSVDPYKEMRVAIEREAPGSIARALTDELKPVVREAITEDVLRAIESLVGLTPTAVLKLTEDLESEDATIRQRAYTLALKYTVGHPAMIQPKDTAPQQQMVVNFALPRPEPDSASQPLINGETVESEEETTRVCDVCKIEKPLEDFESGSYRCTPCFEAARDKILAQYAD